jgi:hypothetical protein
MPPTPFPSKRVMRAYRRWRGWPTPPRVIHENELQAWIERQKGLTNRREKRIIELSRKWGDAH